MLNKAGKAAKQQGSRRFGYQICFSGAVAHVRLREDGVVQGWDVERITCCCTSFVVERAAMVGGLDGVLVSWRRESQNQGKR